MEIDDRGERAGGVEELGPSTGRYRDRSIPSWIRARGEFWDFERTILSAESVDLKTEMAGDELAIYPGLIYKRRQPCAGKTA
jgi:hypothetical protein